MSGGQTERCQHGTLITSHGGCSGCDAASEHAWCDQNYAALRIKANSEIERLTSEAEIQADLARQEIESLTKQRDALREALRNCITRICDELCSNRDIDTPHCFECENSRAALGTKP